MAHTTHFRKSDFGRFPKSGLFAHFSGRRRKSKFLTHGVLKHQTSGSDDVLAVAEAATDLPNDVAARYIMTAQRPRPGLETF